MSSIDNSVLGSAMSRDNEALMEALVNKWAGYVPCDHKHAKTIAVMLDTQRRWFDTNHSTKPLVQLREALGEQWDEAFLHAYSKALQDSPIFDLVACQPMTGPIGSVAYMVMTDPAVNRLASAYTRDEDNAEVPEVRFDIKTSEMVAHPAPSKGIISLDAMKAARATRISADELLKTIFDEVLQGELQHLIAMARNTAIDNEYVETVAARALPDEVKIACVQAGYQIHKRTQRGPGNKLVTNVKNEPKVRGVEDRATIHVDPFYPESDVVLWRQGLSIIDGTLIWSPYIVYFHSDTLKSVVEGTNGDETTEQDVLRVLFRRGVKMVDETGCHLVKFVAE